MHPCIYIQAISVVIVKQLDWGEKEKGGEGSLCTTHVGRVAWVTRNICARITYIYVLWDGS